MLPFPLKIVRLCMAALSQAGYDFYIFAHSEDSPSPPVHTFLDFYTASLISDYVSMVAKGGHSEVTDFTVLYPEVAEDEDIFRSTTSFYVLY